MTKEEFLKAIMELPKVATNNPISAMNGINVDDLMSAIDRLNKVPDYNDLLKENKQLKSILTDLEEWCNDGIKDELIKFDYGTEIIGIPIKIHIASYEMFLDKIQVLKEKYENRRL